MSTRLCDALLCLVRFTRAQSFVVGKKKKKTAAAEVFFLLLSCPGRAKTTRVLEENVKIC